MNKKLLHRYWMLIACLMYAGLISAEKNNVSGPTYASTLPDGDDLVLTGNTVLFMNKDLTVTSISGDYSFEVQGPDHTLTVKNPSGTAINVKTFNNIASNVIASGYKSGIYASGNITMQGGTLTVRGDKINGIHSAGGDISLTGTVDVKSEQPAISARTVTINGDLTAQTTLEEFYCIIGNKVTLTGGTMKINSINYAVCSYGDLTLSGDITAIATGHGASAFNVKEGGNLLIKDGSSITAQGGGNAIYAEGNITMEGGNLTARGTSYEGIYSSGGDISLTGSIDIKAEKNSIYAQKGYITVNGDLIAETSMEDKYCIIGDGVSLTGGTMKITSNATAVGSYANICLSGDITATSKSRSAFKTPGPSKGNIYIMDGSTITATSKETAISAEGEIEMWGGTLTAQSSSGMGISANGGSVFLVGTIDVKAAGPAIRTSNDKSIYIHGDLTAETTLEDFYCIRGGHTTLNGGTMNITSINYAVCSFGDMTLSGNITAKATGHGASAFNVRENGNLLIKDGSQITAKGGGTAIYAEGSITMEGGTLKVPFSSNSYEGVMSRRGDISLTGYIGIEAEKQSIYAEDGDITVNGHLGAHTIGEFNAIQGKNVTLAGAGKKHDWDMIIFAELDAVVSYGNMNLSGNINASTYDRYITNRSKGTALRSYNGGNIYFGKGSYTLDSDETSQAIYADGQIALDPSLSIIKPENGRINGHTIVDSNNNIAKEVDIYYTPKVLENTLAVTPTVKYGEQARIEGTIKALGQCTYNLQESADGSTWRTIKSGIIATDEARAGKTIQYKKVLVESGYEAYRQYRMITTHTASGEKDTSAVKRIYYKYPLFKDGHVSLYNSAGVIFHFAKPADCRDYRYRSDLPAQVAEDNDYLCITMPACPLYIDEYTPTYKVDFCDSDASVIKTEEVEAGKDATPPSMGGDNASGKRKAPKVFKGWDKDYTNVHKDLKVFAKYDVYVDLDMDVVEHTCNRTEDWNFASWMFTQFEDNKTMAMAGDQLTFRASVKTNTPVDVYFQAGQPLSNGEISWTTGQHVGEITGYDVNKVMTFDRQVTALVEYYNELSFEKSRYYRFYAKGNGTAETIYSAAMEIQMYYPLLVNADQEVQVLTNEGGFFFNGQRSIIPVQYNEKVLVLDRQGLKGAGLTMARVNKPAYLTEGYTDEGAHYIVGPGETETLNVTTTKKLVVFDGVYGNGYPKQLDFTAEGFGKLNGYYGEVVPCGGSVTMPADPTEENAIFLGWTSWDPSSYDDQAYLNVPAISDKIIGFTANFEYYDPTPQYTVRFYGKDGTPLLDTQMVTEGSDATPPAAPEISGWHFTGWNKPYQTITEDMDITAIYGEDIKVWTVTYKSWDGSDLGSEQVNDGEAAVGVEVEREGYTFVKWRDYFSGDDVDMEHITANVTVEPVFTETLYTVTYRVNGVETYSVQAVHGLSASSIYYPYGTPTKEATEEFVYTFDYWTPEVETITEDVTFDAVFVPAARQYTVTFQNWDHTLLSEQQVAYGAAASAPSEPTREGYVFDGWDRAFDAVLADMMVTATFRLPYNDKYTISVIAVYGTVNGAGEYLYGSVVELTAIPDEGYLFDRWSDGVTDNPRIVTVTEDVTYTALFVDDPDGIKDIEHSPLNIDHSWYDLTGRMLDKPQKGINIIRYSDGTSRKVLVK